MTISVVYKVAAEHVAWAMASGMSAYDVILAYGKCLSPLERHNFLFTAGVDDAIGVVGREWLSIQGLADPA